MSRGSVPEKTAKSFARIEVMNHDLRECVFEYGEAVVTACLLAGVRNPRTIHQLVREIWEGARQLKQRRTPVVGTLDWVLTQAGAEIGARTLVRILRNNNHCLVCLEPTAEMLDASMAEVADFTLRITKREKHRRRLRAAIAAGSRHIWPERDQVNPEEVVPF